jgi:glyoxylase I family protein
MSYAVHHVALSVRNRQRSVAFYERFGFRQTLLWEADDGSLSIAHLTLDGTALELFTYRDPRDDPEQRRDVGNNLDELGPKHLAVVTDDLDRAHREFADVERCTDIVEGRTGLRYFFVPDPDGIWMEVVQPVG